MDGWDVPTTRACGGVDRRHQGAIFEAVDVISVPPGPPALPPVDTAGAERCRVEEKGAADTAAEHLQRMTDGISLSGLSSLPRSPRDSAPDARRLRSSLAGQQLRTSRKEAHSHLARRPPGAPTASTDKLHTALRAIGPSPRRGRRHAITAECTSFSCPQSGMVGTGHAWCVVRSGTA